MWCTQYGTGACLRRLECTVGKSVSGIFRLDYCGDLLANVGVEWNVVAVIPHRRDYIVFFDF